VLVITEQLALTSQMTSCPSIPLVENLAHFSFVPEWTLTWLKCTKKTVNIVQNAFTCYTEQNSMPYYGLLWWNFFYAVWTNVM